MDFGVVIQTDPPASKVIELTELAEANGFTYGWTFDSHVLWEEPFVIYSQMLASTERMIVGPMVTNPGTRDWTVLASLFATLNEMFGGRTICGMGRGDSALRYINQQPTTLQTMVESMKIIKALVAGESVTYNGKELRIPWIPEGGGWELPMWGAGYGPKALSTIGEHCDGFILQLADPQILEWTMGAVREAAERAGRDPDEISICVVAPAYVGDDIAHQRDQVRWFGGMVGNHVADLVDRYGKSGIIPKALTDYIEARKGYDYDHHGKSDNPSTDFVPDDIVDRFCVLGTVEDHIAKLSELRDLGVDQFGIYLMHDAREATLEAYGREIIPAIN
ncbi:MAG TPA: TIGR03842 family LLM class F420-dependent oxidoreductase, partial [Acidimicrobiia bacterium]|nr:TIGR03842 family LLM class F420-dependent oxidoreductase [Acidimicrobiia bacterium]